MNISEQSSSEPAAQQARWFVEEILPIEPPLRAYLSRSLPSQADIDDVVQDSYVRILKAKEKGVILSAKALLFAIARNLVRDFLHRKDAIREMPITEGRALPVLYDSEGVVEGICHRQELALLTQAIESLPERCREVVLLRKIKRLSQREIAEVLGITENTVESLAVKGVRRCAEYMRARGVNGSSGHA